MVHKMESIDFQIGRAVSNGLKKCRKLRVGKIPFSGLFKKLWQEKRLWILVYKKKVGQIISSTTIRRLTKGTKYSNPMSLPLKEVERLRSEAEKKYQALLPHSRWNVNNSLRILPALMQRYKSLQKHLYFVAS